MYPLLEVHQPVASLLRHPGSRGVGGDPGQVHPPPVHLDDEQDIEAGEADGLDGEEVTGQQRAGLGAQELGPGRTASAGSAAS